MNPRTKLLVGAMVVVFGGLLADQAYRYFVETPANKRERQLNRLTKQIKSAEDAIFNSADAPDELADLEKQSLPYDREMARSRYQGWLLSLVKKVAFEKPSVDAGNPVPVTVKSRMNGKPKVIYHKYGFSVRGRGNLHQLTQFLYQFYQAGHLHKITSVGLNPISGGRSLDVTMSIEALGMTGCERESDLSPLQSDRLADRQLTDYQSVVHRNLFSRDGLNSLRTCRLTAVTFDKSGQPQAWFSTSESPTQVLSRGDTLSLQGHQVKVIDIQPNVALVEVDGRVIKLAIGDTIYEAANPTAQVVGRH